MTGIVQKFFNAAVNLLEQPFALAAFSFSSAFRPLSDACAAFLSCSYCC